MHARRGISLFQDMLNFVAVFVRVLLLVLFRKALWVMAAVVRPSDVRFRRTGGILQGFCGRLIVPVRCVICCEIRDMFVHHFPMILRLATLPGWIGIALPFMEDAVFIPDVLSYLPGWYFSAVPSA